MSTPVITFDSVTKRYGRAVEKARPALDEVSFAVDAGEIFGYIGPNGAGKTTSIKIIVGLIRDYEGAVTIGGITAANSTGGGGTHGLVGYMPQSSGFQEWRSVTHTLLTFGRLSGLDPATLGRRVEETIERVGLTEYRASRLTHLSGGTLQRLRLAQAILHEPKVLVLDEPMSGLDPASRFRLKELIRELATPERVVFFSSHILSDVEDLATRIGIIAGGRMQKIGTPGELRRSFGLGQIVEIETAEEAGSSIDPAGFSGEGVVRAEATKPHVIRLHLDPARELDLSISRILSICVERSYRVRRVMHMKPSLEEVYLRLTGEARETEATE